jgi:hypothetical protein
LLLFTGSLLSSKSVPIYNHPQYTIADLEPELKKVLKLTCLHGLIC